MIWQTSKLETKDELRWGQPCFSFFNECSIPPASDVAEAETVSSRRNFLGFMFQRDWRLEVRARLVFGVRDRTNGAQPTPIHGRSAL